MDIMFFSYHPCVERRSWILCLSDESKDKKWIFPVVRPKIEEKNCLAQFSSRKYDRLTGTTIDSHSYNIVAIANLINKQYGEKHQLLAISKFHYFPRLPFSAVRTYLATAGLR